MPLRTLFAVPLRTLFETEHGHQQFARYEPKLRASATPSATRIDFPKPGTGRSGIETRLLHSRESPVEHPPGQPTELRDRVHESEASPGALVRHELQSQEHSHLHRFERQVILPDADQGTGRPVIVVEGLGQGDDQRPALPAASDQSCRFQLGQPPPPGRPIHAGIGRPAALGDPCVTVVASLAGDRGVRLQGPVTERGGGRGPPG